MEKNVKFRNHFYMVIENLFSIWIIIAWLILQFFSGEPIKENLFLIIILSAIIIIVLVLGFISWRRTTYIFDDNVLIMEKNTLTKTKQTIAMSNITTVNINRTVLQAIFGVRFVKIDTNSSAGTTAEVIIYLKKDDAFAFQKSIMAMVERNKEDIYETRESVEKDNSIETDVTSEVPDKKKGKNTNQASFEDIFLHCIYTLKIVEVIVLALSFGSAILTEAELEEGESAGGVMGIITMAIVVVGIIISFLKSFFAYYKLEAVRKGNELSVSYGFFDNKTFRIPVSKIVSVKVKEPLLGRFFKKAYAEIVCVGMGDEEQELSLISLCTSKNILAAKLHMLLPEFVPEEVKNAEEFYAIHREDKKGMFVRVLLSVFYMMCLVVGGLLGISLSGGDLSEMFGAFGMVILVLCLLVLLYGICKNRSSGYSVDHKYFRITTGAFNKETNIIPYKKIEHLTIRKSPVYKLWKLAIMNVSTKSGSIAGIITNTGYVNDSDIEDIKAKYKKSYVR